MIAKEIWRIVGEIRASGIATILVDKNHSALTNIADRAVIMVKGKVVFDDTSESLKNNPALIQKYLSV